MNVTGSGLDLAMQVFQGHGVNVSGKTVLRKTLRRQQVQPFFANPPPCGVSMESCGGAHYWGRELRALGHDVRLMAPQFVQPYRKNDGNDARPSARRSVDPPCVSSPSRSPSSKRC